METVCVSGQNNRRQVNRVPWVAAIAISVLLHVLVIGLLCVFYILGVFPLPSAPVAYSGGAAEKTVRLEVARQPEKDKSADPDDEDKQEEKKPSFVKTPADAEPVTPPRDSPYIGARPMVNEGGPKAPDDMKEMPAQDGEESKSSEIVLFDQDRQDGAIEHMRDGQPGNPSFQRPSPQSLPDRTTPSPSSRPDPAFADGQQAVPMVPQVVTPDAADAKEGPVRPLDERPDHTSLVQNDRKAVPNEDAEPQDDTPNELARNDEGSRDHVEGADEEGDLSETGGRDLLAKALNSTMDYADILPHARRIEVPAPGSTGKNQMETGQMPLRVPQVNPSLPAPSPSDKGASQAVPEKPKVYYDPAFTAESQPGFKTHERKTRTTGRFSFGRKAGVNVDPTPMGRYQEIIYRAIGVCWYRQTDLNRDVIVPGTLRIRILVDTKGKVTDMRLLSRQGASTAQKSFTFLAIKQADIPPMPPDVVKELVGDKLELFFDFHF